MEPEHITAVILGALICVAGYLMRQRAKTWETRLTGQDDRLDKHATKHAQHDVQIAILQANVDHIRTTGDETSADVKELLKLNGKRSTG